MSRAINDISEDDLKEFQEIFDLADTDKGGSISQEELKTLLGVLKMHPTDEQMNAMMKEYCGDSTEEMTFLQFVQVCTKQVDTLYAPAQLSKAFRYFETSELPTGWMTYNRLEELMSEVCPDFNQVMEIMTSVDPDNTGKINYQMYINLLNTELVRSVPLFNTKGMSRRFIQALVAKLQPRTYKFGDYIVRKSDIGREMFFVLSGFVEVVSEDVNPKIFATLGEGKFFGEIALIFEKRRSASVRAGSYCDLYVINQKDYVEVSRVFPNEANIIRSEALKRLNATKSVDLFNAPGISKKFVTALMTKLQTRSYKVAEIIVKKGDVGLEMFFVTVGSVEIISEDATPIIYATLSEGKFFGEIALVFEQRRTATVRSGPTGCDLYVLDRKDFKEVSLQFPREIALIKKEAEKRLQAQQK
ncbi:cGMP-dependent protein kinase [Acrasis kona]|uniref:PRKG1 n=1 Tax=Acrasis kona TaxID=1008807 RepID=A0AAW2Z7D5_9EUKA